MAPKCYPNRRNFNLFYQIAELRDIPGMLKSSVQTWRELQDLLGPALFTKLAKGNLPVNQKTTDILTSYAGRTGIRTNFDQSVGNLYLNFKFGWQSVVQAVEGLMLKPKQVSKDINILMERNGKNITLSTGRVIDEEWTSPPGMTLYLPGLLPDPNYPSTTRARRQAKIRCVVNSGFQLPELDIPAFREKLFYEKLGVNPHPSDIYDLVPWTWLVDWFTGATAYFKAIEATLMDPSIINWGFVVYKSHLRSVTSIGGFQDYNNATYRDTNPTHPTVETKRFYNVAAGTFTADYKVRIDLARLFAVKSTAGVGLSDYQKSILGSLFSVKVKGR